MAVLFFLGFTGGGFFKGLQVAVFLRVYRWQFFKGLQVAVFKGLQVAGLKAPPSPQVCTGGAVRMLAILECWPLEWLKVWEGWGPF